VRATDLDWWEARLVELCGRIRGTARAAVARALADGALARLGAAAHEGAGDTTFALDVEAEAEVERWFEEVACERPLSLLTEDAGWRHRGPRRGGATCELPDFGHGGPRIALDPIDGTRNAMADVRSAWTVVSCAAPGGGIPRLSELALGLLAEIPDSRARLFRTVRARSQGPCRMELLDLEQGSVVAGGILRADGDDRADNGYFPFFRFDAGLRPTLARIEAEFFARLERHEGADVRRCFDDQYICNAGQLVLLALGTYRAIFDLRGQVARALRVNATTSKPYDIAGAVLCARAAGCVVEGTEGPLDFPLDCSTPLDFVGWHNPATRARLEPHLRAAVAAAALARP
jgi:hypothetical protein